MNFCNHCVNHIHRELNSVKENNNYIQLFVYGDFCIDECFLDI